MSFIGEFH